MIGKRVADTASPHAESCDDNELVTISKKMLPMVSAKINDWLDRCAEFAFAMMNVYAGRIDTVVIERLAALAWPRLLLIYMMEHSFDFCVTRSHSPNHEANRREALAMPRNRDATHLLQLISKGFALGLSAEAYQYLREIILFKEAKDGGDNKCHMACQEAHRKLRLMLPDQKTLFKLLLFLPSIYNVNTEIVKNLFCRSFDFESSIFCGNAKRPMYSSMGFSLNANVQTRPITALKTTNGAFNFGSGSSLCNSKSSSSSFASMSSPNTAGVGKFGCDEYRNVMFGSNGVNLSVNQNGRPDAGGMGFKFGIVDDAIYESVATKIKQEETIVKQ